MTTCISSHRVDVKLLYSPLQAFAGYHAGHVVSVHVDEQHGHHRHDDPHRAGCAGPGADGAGH